MAARKRPRTSTFRDLAEDEFRIDVIRGRRYCGVHRDQQMIPLLPGVDICPACPQERKSKGAQPQSENVNVN